jgi:hypothetical protein
MTYRSCLEAFEDGVHSRLNYPLHMGLYKLSESYKRIQYVRDEVVRVAEVVNGKRSPFSLRSCTNEDKAYWLRDVPTNIAYRVGYEIIPGLRALEFDDVPKGQSEAAALQVESKIPASLVKWDQLRDTYKNRIGSEYVRMRNGQSNALLVVDDALALIDSALKTLPLNIQDGI